MTFRACLLAAMAAFSLSASTAGAQDYPTRSIKVILPVPPGSLTDVIARRIGLEAAGKLGQAWVMENKPGSNFLPAAQACKTSRPDGYTLCVFTTSTLTFNPYLIDDLPYDAEKDFRPIINLGALTGGLVASPKLGMADFKQLQELAVAKPGTLFFGTYGPASSANVFRRYLADKWKTTMPEVTYKGANELVSALIAGEIQLTWTALGNWAENPNDSKGKILVSDGSKRAPKIPDVPTYPEAGLGDYPIRTWMGLFAPAGTPDAIVDQVNKVVAEVLRDPKVVDFLSSQIIEAQVSSPAEFSAFIAREREATGQMLRKFNIPKIN
ncbi:MAG: extra-cytoplasmic solute receptor [Hyphomicrobiales bacterium]|nr:extra-cytoplasmic solute receptor [Hyphomicrobiales bacterium]